MAQHNVTRDELIKAIKETMTTNLGACQKALGISSPNQFYKALRAHGILLPDGSIDLTTKKPPEPDFLA